jgi:hypothetical protein
MGLFDGISNPWEPGGQNALSMPWAKPAMNYGWGHGNAYFHPKTKEQIHKEAMLQLAVLAAIVVAPMVVGAIGAGGAGAAAAGSSAGAAGAGAGAGAGAVSTAGAIESGVVLATQTSVAAATTAGAAGAAAGGLSTAGAMALGGLGALQAMQPFMQPNSMQVLHGAASEGEAPLNEALHRLSQEGSNRVEYQRAQPYSSPISGLQHRVPSLRSVDMPLHDSVPMLVGLAEEISKDGQLQRELRNGQVSEQSLGKIRKHLSLTSWLLGSGNGGNHPWENPHSSTTRKNVENDCPWTIWTHLLKLKIPYQVHDEIRRRNQEYWKNKSIVPVVNLANSLLSEWKIQTLDFGVGNELNRDYYEVRITKLPHIEGRQITALELFRYWKSNFDAFLAPTIADFQEYSDEDRIKFFSEDPLGAVMYFDMKMLTSYGIGNMDDGSVMVTNYTRNSWTFSTVRTPEDHIHPVSGNREFGFRFNPDGSYSYYVMGVDRLSTYFDYGASLYIWDIIFMSADKLWRTWQELFYEKVVSMGGQAEKSRSISERVSWEDYKNCR